MRVPEEEVTSMICGCPHCKEFIPASTPGGMCEACEANCGKHLNAIAQNHGSPTILPKDETPCMSRLELTNGKWIGCQGKAGHTGDHFYQEGDRCRLSVSWIF